MLFPKARWGGRGGKQGELGKEVNHSRGGGGWSLVVVGWGNQGRVMMMRIMVVAEWQDGAGGSSNDSGGLSDLKVSRTAAAAPARV